MLDDIRHSLRALTRNRRFAVPAVAVLAAGIGASALIVALVDAVLLRPLPFPESERLVLLSTARQSDGQTGLPFSLPDFFDTRSAARSVEDLAAWAFGGAAWPPTSPSRCFTRSPRPASSRCSARGRCSGGT